MTKRRTVALVAVLLLVAAACGGDDGNGGAAGTTTTAAAGATTTQPEGEADPDAVLRYQWGTPAGSNYDPHVAFNQFANIFLYPAYDRLMELTPDGELKPMLAESWEFLEGDTVLRLTLRDDVTFHDGTSLDAAAVKANIERGKTLENSAVKADLAPVEEAVVVSEHVVDLRLSGPGAALPALLADRAGMMVSPAAFTNADLDLQPVGAGPYKVKEHRPGSVITFERFEGYWDPEAQTLGGIEITMQLDPEARLRAIQDGQIDGTSLNPDQIARAESAGLTVNTEPIAAAFLLYLNKTKPGLDNPSVRRAISLALDRESITEALHYGTCEPSSQIFPSTYWAHEPAVRADPHDVAQARQLMSQAGYGGGLALSAVVVNVPFYLSQLEVIQAQLGEIGIDLTVTALEPTELLSRFATGGADMYYSQWPGAVDPAKTVASVFAAQASLNPGGYTNPDLVRLGQEGLGVTDQSQRQRIYRNFSKVAAEDHFHVILCNPQAIFVVGDSVGNLRPTLGGSYDFRGVTIRR